jgi:hypothetical protein
MLTTAEKCFIIKYLGSTYILRIQEVRLIYLYTYYYSYRSRIFIVYNLPIKTQIYIISFRTTPALQPQLQGGRMAAPTTPNRSTPLSTVTSSLEGPSPLISPQSPWRTSPTLLNVSTHRAEPHILQPPSSLHTYELFLQSCV